MIDPEEILKIAASQVGVKEEPRGSNWGEKVRSYLAAAGIHAPAPWCCAFVVWCCRHAHLDSEDIETTASCTELLHWARGALARVSDPKRGDIFLLLRANGTAFHTGFVTEVDPVSGRFHTIEGNSDADGSPEGYEVVRRDRPRHAVTFVRLTAE